MNDVIEIEDLLGYVKKEVRAGRCRIIIGFELLEYLRNSLGSDWTSAGEPYVLFSLNPYPTRTTEWMEEIPGPLEEATDGDMVLSQEYKDAPVEMVVVVVIPKWDVPPTVLKIPVNMKADAAWRKVLP